MTDPSSTVPAALLTHHLDGPATGPPVVLLNGGMMSFYAWEPVAEHLRARYRLLRFDFRGQLQSPGAPPDDISGHVRDVVALLDALGWESAHLVGTSFGGAVALALTGTYPERVRSLTLITAMDQVTADFRQQSDEMREVLADIADEAATGSTADGSGRGHFYDLLIARVYSAGYRQREAAMLAARRADVERLPASWFAAVDQLMVALEDFDLRQHLAKISCPVLVVIAGDDRVMAPDRSREMAAELAAEVVEHPTAGHVLVAEEPDWLAAECLRFLDRTVAGRVPGPLGQDPQDAVVVPGTR